MYFSRLFKGNLLARQISLARKFCAKKCFKSEIKRKIMHKNMQIFTNLHPKFAKI